MTSQARTPGASDLHDVAIVMRPWLRYFLLDIAREMKQRYGTRIHAYVMRRAEEAFYQPYVEDGTLDSLQYAGVLDDELERPAPDLEEITAAARDYERRLGRTINSISGSAKMLGAPFSLGGYHFPRSHFYNECGEDRVLQAFVETFRFWEREFGDKNISLVLNGPTEVAAIARLHGIPYRHMIAVGYENYVQWVCNEFHENPLIEIKYQQISQPSSGTAEITQPYLSSRLNNQARLSKLPKLSNLLRNWFRNILNHAYARLRGRGRGYSLREDLKYNYRVFAEFRKVLRTHTARLQDMLDRPFIFFPLAREPEVPYMMMSPEYFYQLPALTSLVRDLPAGYRIAVKEHISAIGPRPRDFYGQIRYFKQVRLLDIRERGVDCVRHATAVATIAGSAGIEAAVAGKPVISFGRHNIYCFLPHVFVVTDESQISGYLERICGGKVESEQSRKDGARFLDAMIASSFDMRQFDWANMQDYAPESVTEAVERLVESVEVVGVPKPEPAAAVA